MNDSLKGKTWPSFTYEVGLEKIREYANAVGESGEVHRDRSAAQDAGFRDVVAPPMFAAVYSWRAMGPAVMDPEVDIDFSRLVHGAQEFTWGELVVAGDEITTTATLTDVSERGGNGFYVFETRSVNDRGDQVCTGVWSNVVRAA